MPLKTREEIESRLVAEMVAEQDEITVFEPKTAIRGFITAVAGTVRELWNDLYRMQRKIFLNTASGTDLDELGGERGIQRRGASSAGVLLTFTGKRGTTIPQGTQVMNPSTRLIYTTQEAIVIGLNNPDLVTDGDSLASSEIIGDVVWALCETSGETGNSQVNTVNKLVEPITDVYTVTNNSTAKGGLDSESDGLFRERIRNYISVLNQGTASFYEEICKSTYSRVLKVKARKDTTRPDGIKLIVVTVDGTPLAPKEKAILKREVENKQRAFTNVTIEDAKYTFISVNERIRLAQGYNIKDVYTKTIDVLAEYFSHNKWDFGSLVSVDNIFSVCQGIAGVEDVELGSFTVNTGNLSSAEVTQIIRNQTATSSTPNSITDSSFSHDNHSLINKYVKITSGESIGETKQIRDNAQYTITIQGNWQKQPASGSHFQVVELYRYSSRTQIVLAEDTLPYFSGLLIHDLRDPLSVLGSSGIKNTQHTSNQNQNQNNF
jgi:uncharacterized phage protein gp47/JayE